MILSLDSDDQQSRTIEHVLPNIRSDLVFCRENKHKGGKNSFQLIHKIKCVHFEDKASSFYFLTKLSLKYQNVGFHI